MSQTLFRQLSRKKIKFLSINRRPNIENKIDHLQMNIRLLTKPIEENKPMKKGMIAKKIPKRVFLKSDKEYAWCSCGYSKKQPFCDGSHKTKPTELTPIIFKPEKNGNYFLCRCKQTNNRPYCDLTHIKTFIPETRTC